MFFILKKSKGTEQMRKRLIDKGQDPPLLYYRTKEEIEAYRKKPVTLKLQWLEAQMEFFYKAMPVKAKRIREKFTRWEI
jgi:hypothetical protein